MMTNDYTQIYIIISKSDPTVTSKILSKCVQEIKKNVDAP